MFAFSHAHRSEAALFDENFLFSCYVGRAGIFSRPSSCDNSRVISFFLLMSWPLTLAPTLSDHVLLFFLIWHDSPQEIILFEPPFLRFEVSISFSLCFPWYRGSKGCDHTFLIMCIWYCRCLCFFCIVSQTSNLQIVWLWPKTVCILFWEGGSTIGFIGG
jgi:hypothetical protein